MRKLILGAVIAATAAPAMAADVGLIFLGRSQFNTQVGDTVTTDDAGFFAGVDFNRDDIGTAELKSPSDSALTLNPAEGTSFNAFYTNFDYPSIVADFGNGTYTLSLTTIDLNSVEYLVDIDFADLSIAPVFTNPFGFDGLDATQDFVVGVNGFTAPTGIEGSSFLYIYGDNFFYAQSFLASDTTSLLLPANTLLRGASYRAEIIFSNRTFFSTDDIENVVAFADNRTSLDFSTSAIPEPGTWATMIVGFGMVGAGLRANRKRALAV